jgi:catechol 2,3-dioxygenase-like lactoylglutathione lyase family enzyme
MALSDYAAYATIPAQDMARARDFYENTLGLKGVEAADGVQYQCGGTRFLLFQSHGEPSGSHTQMGWDVDNVEAEVDDLIKRGVKFEQYDLPGLKTDERGIAEVGGMKGAWFKDTEGNILAIGVNPTS